MRFHLRHASASSSFKLCLLKASSLRLARRASRPFFFPLASTKPPLSELGRSFGLLPPQAPLGTLGKPSAVSVVIPLKSSYRNPFRGFLRVASPSRFQHSSEPFSRRAFHPVAVLACREIYHTTPFCQFFSSSFLRFVEIKIKTYLIINVLHFYFFLIKKPLSPRKRPKRFRSPKFLSTFCLLHSFSS